LDRPWQPLRLAAWESGALLAYTVGLVALTCRSRLATVTLTPDGGLGRVRYGVERGATRITADPAA
jgi:hypothetical protein